tara:strand:- start:233 stop:343 length:111 start_codon:yes stop_codon:yes gene_type:complete
MTVPVDPVVYFAMAAVALGAALLAWGITIKDKRRKP